MDIKSLVKKIKQLDTKKKVKFIILYGSVAKGTNKKNSDIDLAVYYDQDKKARFNFRIKLLGEFPEKVDLQIFQDLPLYIRKEVIAGKLLYSKNFDFTFNKFMETIKEFDSFERFYNLYLKEVERRVKA